MDAEAAAVVVGLRAGLADQLVEALLALGGDRVDHLAAPAGERRRVGRQQRVRVGLVGGDEPGRVHPLERRVERAEGDAAQAAEHLRRAACAARSRASGDWWSRPRMANSSTLPPPSARSASVRCIETIHRQTRRVRRTGAGRRSRPGRPAGPSRTAVGRAEPADRPSVRTLAAVPGRRSVVDYSLQRRAVLADVYAGRTGLFEVCDASPYLSRAAKYHGEATDVACPVCRKERLTLRELRVRRPPRSDAGQAKTEAELARMDAMQEEFTVYDGRGVPELRVEPPGLLVRPGCRAGARAQPPRRAGAGRPPSSSRGTGPSRRARGRTGPATRVPARAHS